MHRGPPPLLLAFSIVCSQWTFESIERCGGGLLLFSVVVSLDEASLLLCPVLQPST